MSAPAAIISHGISELFLMEQEITTRLNDFDDGTMVYYMPAQDSLVKGAASPDYPSMIIQEINARMDADAWIGRCRVQGLITGVARRIDRVFTPNNEGFDEGSEVWLVKGTLPSYLRVGAVPSLYPDAAGYSNMRVVSVATQTLWGGFQRVNVRYLGSLGTKAYKRRITCEGQVVQPGEPLTVNLPGGFTNKKGRVEFPEIVIEDSYMVTAQPLFTVIPGAETPPDAPAITTLVITGDLTYQWPHGWTIENISYDPIPGTTIGPSIRRYKYKWPTTF